MLQQNSLQLSDLIRPSLFLGHPPNQKDDLALIIEDFLEVYHHQYIIHALNGRVRKKTPASKHGTSLKKECVIKCYINFHTRHKEISISSKFNLKAFYIIKIKEI
jgi:hypothetical protein